MFLNKNICIDQINDIKHSKGSIPSECWRWETRELPDKKWRFSWNVCMYSVGVALEYNLFYTAINDLKAVFFVYRHKLQSETGSTVWENHETLMTFLLKVLVILVLVPFHDSNHPNMTNTALLTQNALPALKVHKVHRWKCRSKWRDRNGAWTKDRLTEQTQFVYQTDGQIAMAKDMVVGQLQK